MKADNQCVCLIRFFRRLDRVDKVGGYLEIGVCNRILTGIYRCNKNIWISLCPNREGMKSIWNTIFKYLLVILFGSYYMGGTAFTHTHYFPTYSITHSHPFLPGSDGLPQHTHSTDAFCTIEGLDEIAAEVVSGLFVLATTWILLSVFFRLYKYITFLRPVRNFSLRSPPICIK